MSLADTPLSKLRQEENEIILYQNQEAQAKNYDQGNRSHYANSGFDSTLLAPATPNQMCQFQLIHQPHMPCHLLQTIPTVTPSSRHGKWYKTAKEMQCPVNSLLASATKATHHPNMTSAMLKYDLPEQHSRLKQQKRGSQTISRSFCKYSYSSTKCLGDSFFRTFERWS